MEVIIDGVKYVPMPDVPTDKGLLAALEVRFNSDAGDNLTVRDYQRDIPCVPVEEGELVSVSPMCWNCHNFTGSTCPRCGKR